MARVDKPETGKRSKESPGVPGAHAGEPKSLGKLLDSHQLITGIALGVLATLASGNLFNMFGGAPKKEDPPDQSDARLLRARVYGMTPEQLDKFDPVAHSGYVPQNRNALLEAFASIPRPDWMEHVKKTEKDR